MQGTQRPLDTGKNPLKPGSGGSGGEQQGQTARLLLPNLAAETRRHGTKPSAWRDDDTTAQPGRPARQNVRVPPRGWPQTSSPPIFPRDCPEDNVPCRPRRPRALPAVPPLCFPSTRGAGCSNCLVSAHTAALLPLTKPSPEQLREGDASEPPQTGFVGSPRRAALPMKLAPGFVEKPRDLQYFP